MTPLEAEWAPGAFLDATAEQVHALLFLTGKYDSLIIDSEIDVILEWVLGLPYPGGAEKLIVLLKQSLEMR